MRVRVASAGTGKTTSLVRRFLERIGEGEPLRRMAGVTFTRNAAAELRARVGEGLRDLLQDGSYLGGLVTLDPAARPRYQEALRELDGATLTTIHGFMSLGLRLSAPLLGLDPDFTALPEWEAQAIFEEEFEAVLLVARDPDHPLHESAARIGEPARPWAQAVFAQRSLAERLAPGPGDARAADLLALYQEAYPRVLARLGATRASPAEIERRALQLVRTPGALARLTARAPRVVVDEFQDVNPLQGRFFAALEAGGAQVEVVGDPKQSIYGFRQADVEVFRTALRTGEVLAPLQESRRHAQVPVRFLNALTRTLAAREWGFVQDEAPEVRAAGAQADVRGRVEVHWVRGGPALGALRPREATVLAERLAEAHRAHGVAYQDMAVLARTYAGLRTVRAALRAQGVPAVLLQGRGYYQRSEVRDLAHALRVGIDPAGPSLPAWLRGPFGGLTPGELDATFMAEDPLAHLEAAHPAVWARLQRMRAAAQEPPLVALRTLVRTPVAEEVRMVDLLSVEQRENVDALLFSVAQQPPGELEVLLERLDLLSRRGEAGDVPQAGEGVSLLTVHASKGLEWPWVAVYDLGGGGRPRPAPLYLEEGRLHLPGGPGFEAARSADATRQRQESYRMLYVAASRARDALILTGSVTDRGAEGWATALAAMKLGPDRPPRTQDDFVLAVHPPAPAELPDPDEPAGAAGGLPEAPWTQRRFAAGPFPPVESPSRVRGGVEGAAPAAGPRPDDEVAEARLVSDPAEGDRLPGQAVAVGTLLHDAIRRDADPTDRDEMALLRAQEVMFPYAPEEQDRLLAEVREMLGVYRSLLGGPLPALEARTRDLREWPVVLPEGGQVWQGLIDRLYLAEGTWYLDDYKTDRTLRPERYAFQLAVYREAVLRVSKVRPVTRLVGLRDGAVLPYDNETLRAAWAARRGAGRQDG
ncbi:MAG: UvrD-helicase domain-containing protein [Trueperaceae bacterium]|nr:UvrD-helicase domain-containing protein [Trueperaceae bacterium]